MTAGTAVARQAGQVRRTKRPYFSYDGTNPKLNRPGIPISGSRFGRDGAAAAGSLRTARRSADPPG